MIHNMNKRFSKWIRSWICSGSLHGAENVWSLIKATRIHRGLFLSGCMTPPTGKLDGSDLVPFEALLELARRGWTHERRMTSRKVDTYKPNGTKKWFFNKNVCKYYLKVLLSSDRIFEMGLKEIYHFQPATYYKTILFMMKFPEKLNTVKPWQSRSFYILMQQQAVKPTAKRTSAGMTGMVLEEECGGRLLA